MSTKRGFFVCKYSKTACSIKTINSCNVISRIGHSDLPLASVSKRVFVRNHSYEIEFHLHVHFHANQTHFHLNGFARGLVLKMRQRETRKWPIVADGMNMDPRNEFG